MGESIGSPSWTQILDHLGQQPRVVRIETTSRRYCIIDLAEESETVGMSENASLLLDTEERLRIRRLYSEGTCRPASATAALPQATKRGADKGRMNKRSR
jgi:hypothetical protein